MLAMLESRFAGWLAKSPTPFSTHDQSQPAAAVCHNASRMEDQSGKRLPNIGSPLFDWDGAQYRAE
jgi:hypothetical protein